MKNNTVKYHIYSFFKVYLEWEVVDWEFSINKLWRIIRTVYFEYLKLETLFGVIMRNQYIGQTRQRFLSSSLVGTKLNFPWFLEDQGSAKRFFADWALPWLIHINLAQCKKQEDETNRLIPTISELKSVSLYKKIQFLALNDLRSGVENRI